MTRKLQDPIARLEAGDCCVKGLFNESRRLSVHIESGSKRRAQAGVLAVLVAIALVGCDKGVKGNPNATGTPGAANAREVVAPAVAATPGRGPNWVAGSQIHPVSSAQEAVPRATGKGMSASSGRSQTARIGVGPGGGLGGNSGLGMTGSFPAIGTMGSSADSTAAAGSTDRTPGGGLGGR